MIGRNRERAASFHYGDQVCASMCHQSGACYVRKWVLSLCFTSHFVRIAWAAHAQPPLNQLWLVLRSCPSPKVWRSEMIFVTTFVMMRPEIEMKTKSLQTGYARGSIIILILSSSLTRHTLCWRWLEVKEEVEKSRSALCRKMQRRSMQIAVHCDKNGTRLNARTLVDPTSTSCTRC